MKQDPNYDSYRYTKVPLDSPYYPMTSKGNIVEHRLVMAQKLGRCLLRTEIVHHLNGKKNDNREENLEIVESNGLHTSIHRLIRKMTLESDI